jgi:hypothetical protein
MPVSVKFKSKIFLPTPRYVARHKVDSALCHIMGSHHSPLCRIAQSFYSMPCHIARSCDFKLCSKAWSKHLFVNFSANSQPCAKIFKTVDQWPKWYWFMKKTQGQKSRETVPFTSPPPQFSILPVAELGMKRTINFKAIALSHFFLVTLYSYRFSCQNCSIL